MTDLEKRAIAEELAAWARSSIEKFPRAPVGAIATAAAVEVIVEEAVTRALSRVTPPSRIQSAERAVLDAACEWRRLDTKRYDVRTQGEQQRLDDLIRIESEAIDRLRDLREQVAGETCGAIGNGPDKGWVSVSEPDRLMKVRCHLPSGHEGEHEGDLGGWRWA